jgi:hypothetical protein
MWGCSNAKHLCDDDNCQDIDEVSSEQTVVCEGSVTLPGLTAAVVPLVDVETQLTGGYSCVVEEFDGCVTVHYEVKVWEAYDIAVGARTCGSNYHCPDCYGTNDCRDESRPSPHSARLHHGPRFRDPVGLSRPPCRSRICFIPEAVAYTIGTRHDGVAVVHT